MKRNIILFPLIACLVALFHCQAFSIEGNDKLIQEALEKSGANEQIGQFPDIVKALLPIQMSVYQGNDSVVAPFKEKIAKEYFRTDDMLRKIAEYLRGNFNRQHLEAYLEWLNTETGKKITQLEIDSTTPDAALAMMAYSIELEENPPSESRVELVNRLVGILDILGQTSKRSGTMYVNIALGINESLPKNRQVSEKQITLSKNIFEATMLSQLEAFLIPSFLYTYQSLTEKEFKKYVDFLDSEAGRWFNNNLFDAQLASIETGCKLFGRDMGTEIAKLKPPKKQKKLKWKNISSPGGAYSLDFPGNAASQSQDIPTDAGNLTMNMLLLEVNNMSFMLSWIPDYPPLMQDEINVEELLTSAATGSGANVGGQVIEATYLALQSTFPGLDYMVGIPANNGLIRSQIFLVQGTFVQLMIAGTINDVSAEENNRFFDSFKVEVE